MRKTMPRVFGTGAALAAALLLVAGCAAVQPYVYKAREFDRDAADFNREPADRTEVSICYGWLFSTPEEAAKLAASECGRFGRRAVARDESFGPCPMLTPRQARFDCQKVAESQPAPRH